MCFYVYKYFVCLYVCMVDCLFVCLYGATLVCMSIYYICVIWEDSLGRVLSQSTR